MSSNSLVVEADDLLAVLRANARHLKEIAFSIPPINDYTSWLVMVGNNLEALAIRLESHNFQIVYAKKVLDAKRDMPYNV